MTVRREFPWRHYANLLADELDQRDPGNPVLATFREEQSRLLLAESENAAMETTLRALGSDR